MRAPATGLGRSWVVGTLSWYLGHPQALHTQEVEARGSTGEL